MNAIVTKIDQLKMSRNGDAVFRRIYFRLEDGSWAVTDVVSSFRNFKYWRPVIEAGVGSSIGGVELLAQGKVNADSKVYVIKAPTKVEAVKQLQLI
jgi:hypothetical protein